MAECAAHFHEEGKVDLCHIDHGFDVDVHIDVSVKKLTTVWMGWEDMAEAIKNGSVKLTGAKKYTDLAVTWLGHSSVAHIQKRSEEQRVS